MRGCTLCDPGHVSAPVAAPCLSTGQISRHSAGSVGSVPGPRRAERGSDWLSHFASQPHSPGLMEDFWNAPSHPVPSLPHLPGTEPCLQWPLPWCSRYTSLYLIPTGPHRRLSSTSRSHRVTRSLRSKLCTSWKADARVLEAPGPPRDPRTPALHRPGPCRQR